MEKYLKGAFITLCTTILKVIIFYLFNCPPVETRSIFLDISKAFDRVWHEGLLFKLKCYAIKGSLLTLIKGFLSDRLQRVVLNGKCSTWREVLAGVPQGSILGPLFFIIFINDLPIGLQSNVKIFADDTALFSAMSDNLISSNILNILRLFPNGFINRKCPLIQTL